MNKLLTIGAATLAIAGFAAAGTVGVSALNGYGNGTGNQTAAHNGYGNGAGYQTSLEERAQVVNMTAEQLRTELQTKTMAQIALEQGMDEATFQAKMTEMAQARWAARGLSAEEIAQRVAEQEQRRTTNQADGHEFGTGTAERHSYGRNS